MRIRWSVPGLLFLLLSQAYGGSWLRNQKGQLLYWKGGKVTFELSEVVHLTEGDTGVDRRESAASVHAAVWNAARAWGKASGETVSIELTRAPRQTIGETGNLITFTDPAPFDKGTCDKAVFISCAIVSFDQETGEILSVNIAFNPYKKHSSTGLAGTHDIGLTAMHEFGHALGLDHSPVLDAVMNSRAEWEAPANPLPQFAIRQLSSDDVRTLAVPYPFGAAGRIEGVVRKGDAPVSAAHVLALDSAGQPVHGVVTNPEGAYSLQLPPGDYRLLAEPLDGPSVPNEVLAVVSPSAPFPTVYWTVAGGVANGGDTVTVRDGETRTAIDFAIPSTRTVNADTIGFVANASYWGTARVHVGRGRSYTLALTRTPPEGEPAVRLPGAVKLDGPATATSATPQLVRQKIQLAAGAALGSFVVEYASQEAVAVMPGALRIVPNPSIASVSPLGGNLFAILGTDLAAGVESGERWFDAAPLPTQLANAAVRVAGRFAPLVAVSPTEIVFEWPEGAAGNSAVIVVTGAGVESAPVAVR